MRGSDGGFVQLEWRLVFGAGFLSDVSRDGVAGEMGAHFLDDGLAKGRSVVDCPVLGGAKSVGEFLDADCQFLVAFGDNIKRDEILLSIEGQGGALTSVVHPSAVISSSAVIEPGTVVCAGVIVNARVRIGCGAIVNTSASIDHDCELDYFNVDKNSFSSSNNFLLRLINFFAGFPL